MRQVKQLKMQILPYMQSFLCIVTDAGEVHQLQQQQCIIQTQRNPWETNDATSPTAKSSATFNACPNS